MFALWLLVSAIALALPAMASSASDLSSQAMTGPDYTLIDSATTLSAPTSPVSEITITKQLPTTFLISTFTDPQKRDALPADCLGTNPNAADVLRCAVKSTSTTPSTTKPTSAAHGVKPIVVWVTIPPPNVVKTTLVKLTTPPPSTITPTSTVTVVVPISRFWPIGTPQWEWPEYYKSKISVWAKTMSCTSEAQGWDPCWDWPVGPDRRAAKTL